MADVKVVTESKDSFYVHLLSNAQPHLFKNKANHFKCQLDTALQFPADEAWEVGLKEYHYVNNIDTITHDVAIEVGRLAPKRETWKCNPDCREKVVHDAEHVAYPFYFTECGTSLTVYKPFQDMLSNDQRRPQTNLMAAFFNFLQQQRLLGALRVVMHRKSGKTRWFQLKLRNTTDAVEQLYFPNQYVLCLSYPLALILNASTQWLCNDKENLVHEDGMWTQNEHSWLGNDLHFKTFTLRTDVTHHKMLASVLMDVVCRRMNYPDPAKITNPFFVKKVRAIETFLRESMCARVDDYTFSMVPLHRTKHQRITLKTANLTYVDLFRHLEELGYGALYITPDQSSLTFTMHDLSDSNLFGVELPTSLFAHYNKQSDSFYPPQVRVDQWKLDGTQFVRHPDVPLENAFSTLSLSYADPNMYAGITTWALESLLSKSLENDKDVPNVQAWVTAVFNEINTLKHDIQEASVPFLRGRCPAGSKLMATNDRFLLTSNMRLTMTLDLNHRKNFTHTNPSVYTPYNYTLYDVKLPYSPESITITSYTRSLEMGKYDIKKDARTFQEVYTRYNTITAPKGFYTPLSLIRHLQSEFDKYQYPCTLSLVNKTEDDNGQGFLKIENNKDTYLQFNATAQELFHLPEAFLSPNSSFTTTKPFDLQPDSFTNIIYCNIVGESVVASQREKILNISPVRHSDYKYGQWVGKEFASADYYPLAMKTVQQIEIQFRGDTGVFIPITQGRSYVKLHFQRTK